MPSSETIPQTWRQRLHTPMRVFIGILILDVGVWAFADVWQRHSPDDYAMRVAGCKRHAQDLVIVGGSPVSEGIVPDELCGGEAFPEGLLQGGLDGFAGFLPGAFTFGKCDEMGECDLGGLEGHGHSVAREGRDDGMRIAECEDAGVGGLQAESEAGDGGE